MILRKIFTNPKSRSPNTINDGDHIGSCFMFYLGMYSAGVISFVLLFAYSFPSPTKSSIILGCISAFILPAFSIYFASEILDAFAFKSLKNLSLICKEKRAIFFITGASILPMSVVICYSLLSVWLYLHHIYEFSIGATCAAVLLFFMLGVGLSSFVIVSISAYILKGLNKQAKHPGRGKTNGTGRNMH